MRILFVMDPVEKCHRIWDTSLYLMSELFRRGIECWTADSSDLWLQNQNPFARARKIKVALTGQKIGKHFADFIPVQTRSWNINDFDLVLIRKDPPFDTGYFYLTCVLEYAKIPVQNSPRGIRNTNEKLSVLHFPKWAPETVVSNCPEVLAAYQKRRKKPVVIKPLDNKAGQGVFLLKNTGPKEMARLKRATLNGRKTLMAQEFIPLNRSPEKRIAVLNGNVLGAFEKHAKKGEFRANLSLGASFRKTKLTAREKKMVSDLKPYLLKNGLWFAGLDTRNEKLIELNVTSPAGIPEIKFLNPELDPVKAWADFLVRQAGC